jgi:hypothetical protein
MIAINFDKAKVIAHQLRREARAKEFAPLDEQIAKQIPGTPFQAVEAQRQLIRDKYSEIQEQINAATSIEGLKAELEKLP